MGAWGSGAFDNDDSGDWLDELQECPDATVIAEALDRVVAFEDGYLEEPDGSHAVAAAEVVAALKGHPPADFDEVAEEWVTANRAVDVDELVPVAVEALQRIRTSSELKDLWDESQEPEKWYAVLDDITRRLGVKKAGR